MFRKICFPPLKFIRERQRACSEKEKKYTSWIVLVLRVAENESYFISSDHVLFIPIVYLLSSHHHQWKKRKLYHCRISIQLQSQIWFDAIYMQAFKRCLQLTNDKHKVYSKAISTWAGPYNMNGAFKYKILLMVK